MKTMTNDEMKLLSVAAHIMLQHSITVLYYAFG